MECREVLPSDFIILEMSVKHFIGSFLRWGIRDKPKTANSHSDSTLAESQPEAKTNSLVFRRYGLTGNLGKSSVFDFCDDFCPTAERPLSHILSTLVYTFSLGCAGKFSGKGTTFNLHPCSDRASERGLTREQTDEISIFGICNCGNGNFRYCIRIACTPSSAINMR